jgi:hypothetical protein
MDPLDLGTAIPADLLNCPRTVDGVPRSVIILGRAAAYLAVFVVVAALDTVNATTWIRPDLVAVVGTFACAVPVVVLYVADPWPEANARSIWLVVAMLVNALLMFAVAGGLWTLVLHQRGEQVVATVVDVHTSDKLGTTYTIAYDGVRIPGRLTTWPGDEASTKEVSGSLGERVTVVRDPGGLVDPRLPDEFAEARDGGAVFLSMILIIMAGLCLGASWARHREGDDDWWQSRKDRAARARAREHLAATAAARQAAHAERYRQLRQQRRPPPGPPGTP